MLARSLVARAVLLGSVAAGGAAGCRVFDPQRYLALRDAGGARDALVPLIDAARPDVTATNDAGGDAVVPPTDATLDAAVPPADAAPDATPDVSDGAMPLPVVALADRCDGTIPVVTSSRIANVMDTTALNDDFNQLQSCTGSTAYGFDGFFAVDMRAGEKWHIHVKVPTGARSNPSIYILSSCDERACQPTSALDECPAGRDEHVSFTAPLTSRYIIGIDARERGGERYEVTVLHPVCGNGGMPEHSETCDDGNTMSGDGCDSRCRAELRTTPATEIEPNDEYSNANMVALNPMTGGSATVRAALGGRCDFDEFGVPVPPNGSIRVTVLDGAGNPCPAGFPAFNISLVGTDGATVLGSAAPASGTACPQIDALTAFARSLPMGVYYVRVFPPNDLAVSQGYQVRFDVTP